MLDENPDEVVAHISDRRTMQNCPMNALWSRAYQYYYAAAFAGDSNSGLEFRGEKGEIIKTTVNEVRSHIKQYVSIATKDKLNFEAITSSTDTVTLSNTKIAKELAEFIVQTKKIDIKSEKMGEAAAIFGSAFMAVIWNKELGEDQMLDGEKVISQGDVEILPLTPENVFFDDSTGSFDDIEWVEFRRKVSKFKLAYTYPEHEDEIINSSDAQLNVVNYRSKTDSDSVWEYHLFIKPSKMQPEGRHIVSLDSGVALLDEPNLYKALPIVACIPESFQTEQTCYGYPKCIDLIPLQEAMNVVYSAITTNLSALGVQAILAPEAMGLSSQDIGGLNFITYSNSADNSSNDIRPLQLTANAPDAYNYINMSKNYITELSGLNGVLRGAPPPGVTSGIAMTTLAANALEFIQSFSKAWRVSIEEVMTLAVKCYAIFVTEPRQLPVCGANNLSICKEFVGTDLENIKKIIFTEASGKTLTAGGRIEIAQQLLSSGLIKNVSEFITVIETGSLNVLTDNSSNSLHLIYSENDDLRVGKPVLALASDLHAEHIQQHLTILSDCELRRKAAEASSKAPLQQSVEEQTALQVVNAVMTHVSEHLSLQKNTDPALLAMASTGQVPKMAPK